MKICLRKSVRRARKSRARYRLVGIVLMPKRKFARVAKTKGGVPVKYVRGAKNPKKREEEIKRTSRLYKAGKLTKAEMNRISRLRARA